MMTRLAMVLLLVISLRAHAAEIDWKSWTAETKTLLSEAVSVDTVNPPGNEEALCKRFATLLEKDGIKTEIWSSGPGRANLLAKLPATEASDKKPALWLAHLDVVGVAGQTWTVPPLKATEKDGYLYGRGVLDDKGMAVLGVQLLRLLKVSGVPRSRPLWLMLNADEESSAKYGLAWVIKNHPEALKVEFAINEGGQIVVEDGQVKFVEVQTAEKIYLDLKLETTGPSGHSSLPERENAINTLARALDRLASHEMPVELNETTRGMLEGILKQGGPDVPLIKRLLAGGKSGKQAASRLSAVPHYNALLRTTFVATMLEAGTRVNVLPSKATANINCRVLPGTDLKIFIKQIEKWVADPKVKVVYDEADLESAHASPLNHPFFDAVRKVSATHFPGATVMPVISPGATDSRFLRAMSIPAYGLLPFPMAREDDRRMHAADERLPVASFEPALKFAYDVLVETCR